MASFILKYLLCFYQSLIGLLQKWILDYLQRCRFLQIWENGWFVPCFLVISRPFGSLFYDYFLLLYFTILIQELNLCLIDWPQKSKILHSFHFGHRNCRSICYLSEPKSWRIVVLASLEYQKSTLTLEDYTSHNLPKFSILWRCWSHRCNKHSFQLMLYRELVLLCSFYLEYLFFHSRCWWLMFDHLLADFYPFHL